MFKTLRCMLKKKHKYTFEKTYESPPYKLHVYRCQNCNRYKYTIIEE